jgi:hypothetical protein
MNIQPNQDISIKGIVVKVEDEDFPALKQREGGYDLIEVTQAISIDVGQPTYTFIVREPRCEGIPVSDEYFNTCLSDLPTEQHEQWLHDAVSKENLSKPRKER